MSALRELVSVFEEIEYEWIDVLVTSRTQEHVARRVLERWPVANETMG